MSDIDQLIVRSLRREITPREEEWLRRWRARDPANERRYQDRRAAWTITGTAMPATRPEDVPDARALVARAGEPESEAGRSAASGPVPGTSDAPRPAGATATKERRPDRRWIPAAGALAAGLAALGLGLGVVGAPWSDGPAMAEREIATGPGDMAAVGLADGSHVQLGPDSRLMVTEGTDRVTVELEGRAFFGVSPDRTTEFVVRTPHGDAEVLGTRFEVRSEAEGVRVLVVDGTVRLRSADTAVDLGRREMSRTTGDGPPVTERVEDLDRQLDWMGRVLVFQETPLHRAAEEIGARYDVTVEVETPELAEMTVSGAFTERPLEEVALVVCEIVGARCDLAGDTVRIVQ